VETWLKIIGLSASGALGVNARYWVGVWMNRWASPQFPWATFSINVTGSFLIGFVTVVLTRWLPHSNVRLLAITGFLGGYTTFSTFENDSLTLWERGESILMAANVIGSVAIGFGAVWLGTVLARGLAEPGNEPAVAGSRRFEIAVTGHLHSGRKEKGRSISARVDRFDRVGVDRGTNDESP